MVERHYKMATKHHKIVMKHNEMIGDSVGKPISCLFRGKTEGLHCQTGIQRFQTQTDEGEHFIKCKES